MAIKIIFCLLCSLIFTVRLCGSNFCVLLPKYCINFYYYIYYYIIDYHDLLSRIMCAHSTQKVSHKENTVEPPNKGHIGTRSFNCPYNREVCFIRRLKCTGIIGIGTSRFVLYREACSLFGVSFIRGFTVITCHYNYSVRDVPTIE